MSVPRNIVALHETLLKLVFYRSDRLQIVIKNFKYFLPCAKNRVWVLCFELSAVRAAIDRLEKKHTRTGILAAKDLSRLWKVCRIKPRIVHTDVFELQSIDEMALLCEPEHQIIIHTEYLYDIGEGNVYRFNDLITVHPMDPQQVQRIETLANASHQNFKVLPTIYSPTQEACNQLTQTPEGQAVRDFLVQRYKEREDFDIMSPESLAIAKECIDHNPSICVQCKSPVNLNLCTGCHTVAYCSRECQRTDWRIHKLVCKMFCVSRDQMAAALDGVDPRGT